ncbi:MAG: hypothetical protein ABWY28_16600 [Pseudomonas prosekii]
MSTIAMTEQGIDSALALQVYRSTASPAARKLVLLFIGLSNYEERTDPSLSAIGFSVSLTAKFGSIQDARIAVFSPPRVQGLSTIGGFRLQIEDRGSLGYEWWTVDGGDDVTAHPCRFGSGCLGQRLFGARITIASAWI